MPPTTPPAIGHRDTAGPTARLLADLRALARLTDRDGRPARARLDAALGDANLARALITSLTSRAVAVECLACGTIRPRHQHTPGTQPDACPRCDYVGWALPEDLTDRERRLLRNHLDLRPKQRNAA